MSNKIELTDKDRRQIETLAAVLTQKQMAEFFGFSERTFTRIMQEDAAALAAYKKGRAVAISTVGKSLLSKAKEGNLAAMIFYLKTQAGWREDGAQAGGGAEMPPEPFTEMRVRIVTSTEEA